MERQMMDRISRKILDRLAAINQIPRCSKNEAAIAEWLINWAKDLNLIVQTDSPGNLCIKVPATAGNFSNTGVIIQGHMDMVCEKTPESKHDFTLDSVPLVHNGDWVSANDTTLGADNGIAIAMAMVLVEELPSRCPPLELLFTVDEESGLIGARNLDPELIEGKILLNLDSEDEGIFTVGCAGGQETRISLPVNLETQPNGHQLYELKVKGLQGGHSGIDIHKPRACANKVLARTLSAILMDSDIRLHSLRGGTVHNAIARDALCKISSEASNNETLGQLIKACRDTFKKEEGTNEPALDIIFAPCASSPDKTVAMSSSDTQRTIQLLNALPHGVARMAADMGDLVETSCNLATIDFVPSNPTLSVLSSQRSALMSRLSEITDRITAIANLAGATITMENSYPAWEPNMSSPLLTRCIRIYKEQFSKEPEVKAIHAGLECGLIGAKKKGMDMISFGPTIRFPHSPGERLFVPSIPKVWKFLVRLLESFTT
jgi:dipeptidase D